VTKIIFGTDYILFRSEKILGNQAWNYEKIYNWEPFFAIDGLDCPK